MILVVVGFSAEAALLPPGVPRLIAAANPARLAAALAAMPRPAAILSLGIAGGLDPSLRPGDLIVARHVIAEARWPAHEGWSAAIAEATNARRADIAGSDRIIASAAGKAALRAATGAAAVDMESAAVARLGVPFAVLRAVADTADEALPAAAADGLDEAGNPAPWRVIRALLRRPSDLPGLIRVALRSRTALAALAPHCSADAEAFHPPLG
jgi:adenosylhomocysteine nucleosidase